MTYLFQTVSASERIAVEVEVVLAPVNEWSRQQEFAVKLLEAGGCHLTGCCSQHCDAPPLVRIAHGLLVWNMLCSGC
jgi:hypothetical protein